LSARSDTSEPGAVPVLELRDVRRCYRSGPELIRAVDGVSLSVQAGELIALYGPSGSGKTTLLLLAAGIARPDEGAVFFCGRDLGSMSPREATVYRRRSLGFVFQSFHLQPGLTAIDNAAVKLVADGMSPRKARRSVYPLLEQVGLAERARHKPAALSGGERQRVAIARALANDPPLVFADEPTGNLDTARGAAVLELLASVCRSRGAAVLLVTHDPAAAGSADRVLALRDGRLFEADDEPPPNAAAIALEAR
jgi:putative ABC transport system ATP-binding protein